MARLAFITGASSGIGQALARGYARRGYRLALVARHDEIIRQWLKEEGLGPEQALAIGADVTRVDSILGAAQECQERLGLPDVVVANAGISVGVDTAEREDLEVMARTFAVNNLGMAATFHPFLKAMRERRSGTLVGIASVAGIRGLPGHGAYCASKAGVISYCESLRGELRNSGLQVVTLVPGYVDTPLTRKNRYRMPFLLDADAFATRAIKVIESGSTYRVIPWQMGVVAKLMRLLPDRTFDRLMSGRPRKHRQHPS